MTQPDFRAELQLLVNASNQVGEDLSVWWDAVDRAEAALATPPQEPPTEQKNWIDEFIAECKPLDPEMAEVLTTEARWRLYGEGDSATPPPEPPTVMEILELSGEIEDAGLGQIDLVRAALERWGHG
jgi:hypothetical protein